VARERLGALFLYARQVLSDYEYSVLLYHIQGYKTSAIAERLGKSSKSVDNAKARVFRRLRQVADSI
jgi:DNA-directed RNA polymerase specialized sigma24 family protein